MSIFEKIIALLEREEVQFSTTSHAPTLTSVDSAQVRGEALSSGAKAIVYKVQEEYVLLVLAADRRLDPKSVKTLFKSQGKRVKKTRFASPEELLDQTGLVPGSVPPLGRPILPYELYIDKSLLANQHISFNAGSLTNSIKMRLEDYLTISKGLICVISKDQ